MKIHRQTAEAFLNSLSPWNVPALNDLYCIRLCVRNFMQKSVIDFRRVYSCSYTVFNVNLELNILASKYYKCNFGRTTYICRKVCGR